VRLAIKRSARAGRDLLDAYAFIGLHNPEAAGRFLDAAQRTFIMLAGAPGIGRLYPTRRDPQLRSARVRPIDGFRSYLVFYVAEPKRLLIVRVVHGARDLPAIIEP
jgi:toxin ParE1/3/4